MRDVTRLPSAPPAGGTLRPFQVDIFDPGSLSGAFAGCDAVISAVGPRPGGPATIHADTARATLDAMAKTDVRRYVVVSASGAYADAGDGPVTRFVVKPILQRVLREGFADIRQMEQLVRASSLDWTVLRPPRLVDKPLTGRYRTAIDRNVRGGGSLSRADTAHALLAAVADPAVIHHTVLVAY